MRCLLWLLILLSALLYDVAFFFPENLGFLILPSLFLIFYEFARHYSDFALRATTDRSGYCSIRALWQFFNYGFIWGMLVFSIHFIWLLLLLLDKVKAGKCFAVFVYIFGITYFSLTSAVWFMATGFLIRKISRCYISSFFIFLVTCYGYFYLLENYALWFLGRLEGYPFLNPLIPLINFKLFSKILMFVGMLFGRGFVYNQCFTQQTASQDTKFFYLKPDICSYDQNMVSYEYQIYRKLCDLKLWERRDENKQFIIFAPESSFPFPLNMYPDVIELWSNVLPDNAHLFIGTQYKFNEKICQAVCWLNMCRIKNFYVKKHCVPFVEKIPRFYKKLKPVRDVFLNKIFPEGVAQFSRAKKLKQQNYFEFTNKFSYVNDSNKSSLIYDSIPDKTIFIPQICSELFFTSSYIDFAEIAKRHDRTNNNIYIVFFVNDSWFTECFKKIMQGSARLKSLLCGLPLIYIGHEKLKVFD
jgi:apolipoprotein N-acyltransferase